MEGTFINRIHKIDRLQSKIDYIESLLCLDSKESLLKKVLEDKKHFIEEIKSLQGLYVTNKRLHFCNLSFENENVYNLAFTFYDKGLEKYYPISGKLIFTNFEDFKKHLDSSDLDVDVKKYLLEETQYRIKNDNKK